MNGMGITNLPIRIRLNSANEGDYETKTYSNATFDEAVSHLQGEHQVYDDGSGGHRDKYVYVVAVYPETFEENLDSYRGVRKVTRYAEEPVFGYEARIIGRGQKYASHSFCEVGMSSGNYQTSSARLRLQIYELAIRLAEAANTWPACEQCLAEEKQRKARHERMMAEAAAKAKAHAEFHETVSGVPNGMAAHDGMAAHSHEVRTDHDGVKCACGHGRHQGRVCKECAKITPRGMHGTPARCREAGILKEAR